MLVSLNWLKKFTDLPDDSQTIVSRIGSQIAEVESITDLAEKYRGIVVAEIAEAQNHPDADKLGLYQVNIGSETVQVVAGDKSLAVGDKVAYIAPGQTVPATFGTDEPFVIENRPLRGQESKGMLASAKELSWGEDHAGVLKLDTEKPAGTTLVDAYELNDLIIEIENKTLTHRPDCFGMVGFAREVAGVFGIAYKTPDWLLNMANEQKNDSSLPLSIKVSAEDCNRYVGLVIDGVSIKPSPIILQSYLARIGIRPINNIVDITNYLMAETGQPLHAFDYDKVKERSNGEAKIVVRYPEKSEKLSLLDGREIEPQSKAVLIATDKEAIALGGAMGGADTEVDENTTRIIIESANFDLYNIRKTSMEHGVFTEAVTRFIRGQSPEQCLPVATKAAAMIIEDSGGATGEVIDVYPDQQETLELSVAADYINSRLGAEYSADDMASTLNNVEIKTQVHNGDLKMTVPYWRRDIHIAEDVVEEVGRLKGYDLLPPTLPTRDLSPAKLSNKQQLIIDARKILVEAGSNELLTYNFVAENDLVKVGQDPDLAFKLRNSISPKLQLMRTALVPSLLEKVHTNIKLGYLEFGLFEIGKSHRNNNMDGNLPVEEQSVAYVYSADHRIRNEETNGSAYYQAVYVLNYLLDKLHIGWTDLVPVGEVEDDWLKVRSPSYSTTSRTAAVVSDKGVVGIVGEVCPNAKKAHKLPVYSSAFELNLDLLVELQSPRSVYSPLNKYPGTHQDVTFAVSQETSVQSVMRSIAEVIMSMDDMDNAVGIIDIFQKDDQTKNLTYRLDLQHKTHTLTSEEANQITDSVVGVITGEFKAKRV